MSKRWWLMMSLKVRFDVFHNGVFGVDGVDFHTVFAVVKQSVQPLKFILADDDLSTAVNDLWLRHNASIPKFKDHRIFSP
uniref:Uncharacterized protein n=1 Tax=Strongyloides venezuelensis TaxID=75913 RepID=A0A0K0FFG9_STRVS